MFSNVLNFSLQAARLYENKELTKEQTAHKQRPPIEQENIMIKDIRSVLARSSQTIWQDIAGGTALMVFLLAALHLPGTL